MKIKKVKTITAGIRKIKFPAENGRAKMKIRIKPLNITIRIISNIDREVDSSAFLVNLFSTSFVTTTLLANLTVGLFGL